MAKKRQDTQTMDLLSWEPPSVSIKFEDEARIKAASIQQRISLSVSATLDECGLHREDVARRMGEFLDADISVASLNKFASQSSKDHTISLARAEALLHATGDPRIFGDLLARHGLAVIPIKYVAAIEEAMITDQMEILKEKKARKRREWKS